MLLNRKGEGVDGRLITDNEEQAMINQIIENEGEL